MIDQFDDDIRELIATERDRAPLPRAWHEIVDRHDRRTTTRRPPMLFAAAAILAIGLLGLIALATWRDANEEPADIPPSTSSPATNTTIAATPADPLADLADTDWVVPNTLPDGYTRLIAWVGQPDGSSSQVFGTPDGASRVFLTVGDSRPDSDDAEAFLIDGATWQRRTQQSGGIGDSVELVRNVDERSIALTSVGDPDILVQLAEALVVVPGDEIDFEYLDPDGTYTDVATLDAEAVTLRVVGLNGYYCWEIELQAEEARGRGSCNSTTTPEHPVEVMGSLTAGRSYAVGLAEPNVARIDFEAADSAVVSVVPVDTSGRFDQGFWIAQGSGMDGLNAAVGVVIHLDDGSTIDLVHAPDGTWTVPAEE